MLAKIEGEIRPDFDKTSTDIPPKTPKTRFTPIDSPKIVNGITRQAGTVYSCQFLHLGDAPKSDPQEDGETKLQRTLENEARTGRIPQVSDTEMRLRDLERKRQESSGGNGRRR